MSRRYLLELLNNDGSSSELEIRRAGSKVSRI